MSHHTETIICPNCGSEASNNYCSQCGQPTHLHKDTFGGLITHFIGHYFHYDSKFWQTMKALLFHPGMLTIAYKEKKRMRYIAPISLYIFISAMFFLASSLPSSDIFSKQDTKRETHIQDSVALAQRKTALQQAINAQEKQNTINAANTVHGLHKELQDLDDKIQTGNSEALNEKVTHTFPKIFFFLIPLTGFIITLLFARRKDNYFADHTIFSLHYHSFWFTVMLIPLNIENEAIALPLTIAALIWTVIYFVLAFKNVYKTSWVKTIFYSLIVGVSYFLVFITLFVAMLIKFTK